MTITKALTKSTICAFRAKKWRGTTKKFIRRFAQDRCPHFQIRSGATDLILLNKHNISAKQNMLLS